MKIIGPIGIFIVLLLLGGCTSNSKQTRELSIKSAIFNNKIRKVPEPVETGIDRTLKIQEGGRIHPFEKMFFRAFSVIYLTKIDKERMGITIEFDNPVDIKKIKLSEIEIYSDERLIAVKDFRALSPTAIIFEIENEIDYGKPLLFGMKSNIFQLGKNMYGISEDKILYTVTKHTYFRDIDNYILNTPASVNSGSINDVAEYIKKFNGNELERIRAAYLWIATFFIYKDYSLKGFIDSEGYTVEYLEGRGDRTTQKLKELLKSQISEAMERKYGVCQDFTLLFQTLSRQLDFKSEYHHSDGHAWNAVVVKNKKYLIDITADVSRSYLRRSFLSNDFMLERKTNHFRRDSDYYRADRLIDGKVIQEELFRILDPNVYNKDVYIFGDSNVYYTTASSIVVRGLSDYLEIGNISYGGPVDPTYYYRFENNYSKMIYELTADIEIGRYTNEFFARLHFPLNGVYHFEDTVFLVNMPNGKNEQGPPDSQVNPKALNMKIIEPTTKVLNKEMVYFKVILDNPNNVEIKEVCVLGRPVKNGRTTSLTDSFGRKILTRTDPNTYEGEVELSLIGKVYINVEGSNNVVFWERPEFFSYVVTDEIIPNFDYKVKGNINFKTNNKGKYTKFYRNDEEKLMRLRYQVSVGEEDASKLLREEENFRRKIEKGE